MRLIDADELMEKIKKWLPKEPRESKRPFDEDLCVSMLMEIEEAPTIAEWIPLTQREPKKEFVECQKNKTIIDLYPCLITRKAGNKPYVCKSYYDGEMFTLHSDKNDTENTVAWMPLPEPYKEE